MNRSSHSAAGPREVVHLLSRHWLRWLLPTLAVTVAAAFYASKVSPIWLATQALIVRNEATNGDSGPGKFRGTEEMKNLQETILELAKSRAVLAAALREVGPPTDYVNAQAWPAAQDIDALLETVKVLPPKGVEFGTAEVFYLEVRDTDPARAVRLNTAICDLLQARFQEIRDAKAQSMIDELGKTVHLAKTDLATASGQLTAFEKQVGSDLGELRCLQDSNNNDSALRRSINEIENELRQVRAAAKSNSQLTDLLRAAESDPGRLMAAPSRLFESQPALKRLKDGLVDAQLRTAALRGSMSAAHPAVIAAREAEEQISRHLHDEISIALRGIETEGRVDAARKALLENQLAQAGKRLSGLAAIRATYTSLVAESNHRTRLVERAEQNLAEARASQASAKAASLIARIDSPEAGTRPVNPSRTTILLAGVLGGLLAGFGVVLLTAPAGAGHFSAQQEIVASQPTVESVYEVVTTIPDLASLLSDVQPWAPAESATNGTMTFNQALRRIHDRTNSAATTRS